MNIALIMFEIPDLSGGGGAERFFADFFEKYNDQVHPQNNIYLITDDAINLIKAGKLKSHRDKVITIFNYRHFIFSRNKKIQKIASVFLGNFLFCWFLIKIIIKKKIHIIHLPYYEIRDYYIYRVIDKLPAFIRPKIIFTIVDSKFPYLYYSNSKEFFFSTEKFFYRFFNNVRIDGVYTWYLNVREFILEHKLIKSNPPVGMPQSRFCDVPVEYFPEQKEKTIVYAARLDEQKNPLFFVSAVSIFKNTFPEIDDWKFKIYGSGPLEQTIKEKIERLNLKELLEIDFGLDLKSVFAKSKCFVSTQDYENFPSMSMAEAMSKGNAVIARNVGQTWYFVKNKENGYTLDEDTPENLAFYLAEYIRLSDDAKKKMAEKSIELMTKVHTPANFITQIDKFWDSVKDNNRQ